MENTEGSEGTPTKISDSGYSNSCGNSQSQRSGSSKSRHSGSNSSGSSGYGGKASSSLTNSNEATPQPLLKHKELKKKKLKSTSANSPESSTANDRVNSWNSGTTAERAGNDDDNNVTASPQNNNVNSASQQLKDELIKDCLTPASIHSIQDAHNPSPRNDDINLPSSSISSLKAARFPIPLSGDVLSTPGSLGGKITDDEITNYNSPSKLTEAHFAIKNSLPCIKNKPANQFIIPNSGFSCVVSMKDGVVLYTNTSLTTCLGYPKDMWLGRSFIDFVHPKDRSTFSSHITSGIALPIIKSPVINKEPDGCSVLFCRIRKYRGLRGGPDNSGYGVRERDICYMPFQLDFSFRDISSIDDSGMFLMITAIPVISPYIDWKGISNMFTTRHSSTGTLSHIDPEAVAFIGYLPQEIIGRNIFDFYHPEDMPYLKEVYETVIQMENGFKSRPYRFHIHNGEYITLETEWSAFINPWSRKLEFIVGHHRVLQVPVNVDVFQCVKNDFNRMFSDDMLKLHRQCQDEITKTINEVLIKPSELEKHQISRRCKELASFMDGLNKIPARSEEELRIEIPKEKSLSERDSVMLGEISPHHDYYDSKSSTGTPPSYNQLNYTENLTRFFESHPWTLHKSNTSDLKSSNIDQPPSSPELFIPDSSRKKCFTPSQNDSNSGSSSESRGKFCYSRHYPKSRHMNYSSSKRHVSSPLYDNLDYKPTHLTQDLLNKHNSTMEKLLIKKHKEARSVSKAEEREKSERRERKLDYGARAANMYPMNHMHYHMDNQEHGVKRPGSMMWESDNDPHKISKQVHLPQNPQNFHDCQRLMNRTIGLQPSRLNDKVNQNQNNPGPSNYVPPNHHHHHHHHHANAAPTAGSSSPMNLWPPFSVAMTPVQQSTPTCTETMNPNKQNNINYQNINYQNINKNQNINYQNAGNAQNSNNYRNNNIRQNNPYQNNINYQNINSNQNNQHQHYQSNNYQNNHNYQNAHNYQSNPNYQSNSNYQSNHTYQNNNQHNNQHSNQHNNQNNIQNNIPNNNPNNIPNNNPNQNQNQNPNNPYPGMYPAVYLIPAQQGPIPQQEASRPTNPNGYLMQYMMYPSTMFGTQPIMYSNVPMAYQPMAVTSNHLPMPNNNPSTSSSAPIKPLGLPIDNYKQACQRAANKPMKMVNPYRNMGMSRMMSGRSPMGMGFRGTPLDSQNASLKAESGSRVGSRLGSRVGSHSSMRLLNSHMKNNQGRPISHPLDLDDNALHKDDLDGEGSSYSSFYSSVLRADSSNSTENVDSDGDRRPKPRSSKYSNSSDKYNSYTKMRKHKSSNNSKRTMWNKLSQPNDSSTDENIFYKDGDSYKTQSSSTGSSRRSSHVRHRAPRPARKLQPPWMDSVSVTPELIYKYQLDQRNVDDVLEEDRRALDNIDQPSMVNDQLSQLYIELQLEGLSSKLKLEEGITSSSSDEEPINERKRKKKHNKLVMIYEEDAPLPSPSSD